MANHAAAQRHGRTVAAKAPDTTQDPDHHRPRDLDQNLDQNPDQDAAKDANQDAAKDAAKSAAGGLRPLLLRAATRDFIAQIGHEPAEIHRFAELAGHLFNDATEAELGEIAAALSHHPDAPPQLLLRILNRGGAPARKILRRDPRIGAATIALIARDGACAEAAAIAGRKDLDAGAVAALAARPEREILRRLAENPALTLAPDQWRRLIARGRDDATLASALLGRDDAPAGALAPLFLHADPGQRARLLAQALDAHCGAQAPAAHIGAQAPAARQGGRTKARAATPALLRAQKPGALALALARALDGAFFRARRLVADPSGEALVMGLRAVGLDADDIEAVIAAAAPRLRARENFSAALALAGATPRAIALDFAQALLAPDLN